MAFVDEVSIEVVAGRGGRGCVAFHRARHIPLGGPNGGDGGAGGAVYLVADPQYHTLSHLRRKYRHQAQNGRPGGGAQKTGAHGENCYISVPLGTKIYEHHTNFLVKDMLQENESFMVAGGGEAGLGNIHFKSSTNRSPRQCTPGSEGEVRQLRLELQVLADVGLLGFPNAGKSTFIGQVSAAKPTIADYPFTTLKPHLGVVDLSPSQSFVMADIPGLIAGAADGVGLGHQFLKHLSRCQCLLHLVAFTSDDPDYDPLVAWQEVNQELKGYAASLADKTQILVLTKADLVDKEIIEDVKRSFAKVAKGEVFVISSFSRQGVNALMQHLGIVVRDSHIERY